MNWDSVLFMDMIHNQQLHTITSSDHNQAGMSIYSGSQNAVGASTYYHVPESVFF